ncbi:site-2 protease family protein [Actinomadura viridis]|uniref:Zinc metalloprotease n=1 Tax=Actinomadura viridis TaxID=58110 RepID=A0A931GN68_9ACTN|nr:site-2 protease family protein [Actinomadura viridis]MBG6089196.1 Zn-dependent protease/CBS domain-containing protein [Actinomadura viridis]
MGQSFKLGEIKGIVVGANWSVLVILLLVAALLGESVLPRAAPGLPVVAYWSVAVLASLLFLASLLAHELAHALVARRYAIRVKAITLWMLGGVAELEDEAPHATADLRIAAAGPATSLLVGGALVGVSLGTQAIGGPVLLSGALMWVGLMNGLLAVFNLLPGAPLDGGRVLRAVIWRIRGDRESADRAAATTGRVLGYALMGLGLAEMFVLRSFNGLWLVFLGWFITAAAGAEASSGAVRRAAGGLRVADIMTPDPDCGHTWRRVSDFAAEVTRGARQSVFPVVGLAGDPAGAVSLEMLARALPGRADAMLGDIMIPLPGAYVARPGDSPLDLLNRRPLAGELMAVVVDGGRTVGIVTTADVQRLVRSSRLRQAATTAAASRTHDVTE